MKIKTLEVKKTFLTLCITLAVTASALGVLGYGLLLFRRHAQEEFGEAHQLLSGENEGNLADNKPIDAKTFKKFDNTTNPLHIMDGAVSWKILAKAKLKPVPDARDHALKPVFTPEIQKLDHQRITAQGFMFPLDANDKQSHFVLSPYPVSCPYCMPAGPSELIEVFSDKPIKFGYEPIALSGEFKLLKSSEEIRDGMLYQLSDAHLTEK